MRLDELISDAEVAAAHAEMDAAYAANVDTPEAVIFCATRHEPWPTLGEFQRRHAETGCRMFRVGEDNGTFRVVVIWHPDGAYGIGLHDRVFNTAAIWELVEQFDGYRLTVRHGGRFEPWSAPLFHRMYLDQSQGSPFAADRRLQGMPIRTTLEDYAASEWTLELIRRAGSRGTTGPIPGRFRMVWTDDS